MSIEPQESAASAGAVSPSGATWRGQDDYAPPAFQLDVQRNRGRVWVTLWGEVDLATAGPVSDAPRVLQAVGRDRLVLDLRRMSFVDCAALRVLFDARARARARGTKLEVLCDAGQLVQRLLALTGTDEPIGIDGRTRAARVGARRIDEHAAA